MGNPMKKAVLVCALLAVLMCYQPLALFLGSMAPHVASHGDKSDVLDHTGTVLPQEWGLRKTIAPAVRVLSASLFQTGMVIQQSVPSESGASAISVALDAQPAASGFAYLNNLSLRC
ncbi:MAG: hypothetical protein A4E57_02650 [Syntrophorhabdaceae bacterium PtaU1.Bin034]|nr:MAG: hypothetical protein A4E57_02650 [Syntrophorhabdaceae bacterium PtaU1.Bin034]